MYSLAVPCLLLEASRYVGSEIVASRASCEIIPVLDAYLQLDILKIPA